MLTLQHPIGVRAESTVPREPGYSPAAVAWKGQGEVQQPVLAGVGRAVDREPHFQPIESGRGFNCSEEIVDRSSSLATSPSGRSRGR